MRAWIMRGRRGKVDADHLDADVIRSSPEVILDSLADGGRIAPRDDGVDECIAASVRDVAVAPSETYLSRASKQA